MSSDDASSDKSTDLPVNQIVRDYLESGEPSDAEGFLIRHPLSRLPEAAADFREFIAADRAIDRVLNSAPPGKRPFLSLAGFEVQEFVGKGGMGVVYRARQCSVNRDVALKLLHDEWAADPRRLSRFKKEVETLAKLQAAHIVSVIDVFESERGPVLVMPFISGTNLSTIIRDRFSRDRDETESSTPAARHRWSELGETEYLRRLSIVFEHLLQAVAAVHAENLLHRDIKPSNILVDNRDCAWLSDFGLARDESAYDPLTADGSTIAPLSDTVPGTVPGTNGFIPPEGRAGERIDQRSDIFACGVTMYQALTGTLPYGRAPISIDAPLPRPPSESLSADCRQTVPGLDAVVFSALHPNPEQRCRTATGLLEMWQAACQGKPVAEGGPIWRKPTRFTRRRWTYVAAVAVAALAFYANSGKEVPAPTPRYSATCIVDPPDVRAVLIPIDDSGLLQRDKVVGPVESEEGKLRFSGLAVGWYLLEVAKDRHGFIQVYRRMPAPGEMSGQYRHLDWLFGEDGVTWHDLKVVKCDAAPPHMSLFSDEDEEKNGGVAPFWLDATEVTRGDIRSVLKPGRMWPPALNEPDDDRYAIKGVPLDVVLAYAEKVGKRLPTEREFEFAATNGGSTKFPWGANRLDDQPVWNFGGPVATPEYDRTNTNPPCFGLMSNAAEWTSSTGDPGGDGSPIDFRVIKGAPMEVLRGRQPENSEDVNPRYRLLVHSATQRIDAYPQLGFRCARSLKPLVLEYIRP